MNQQLIQTLENLRCTALSEKDYDRFKSLCHPDLIYIHTSGKIEHLEEYYQKLCSGFYRYEAIEFQIQNNIDLGSSLLVVGEFRSQLTVDGKQRILHNRTTSTWLKTDASFQLICYQSTPMP
ncbi:nuclear transport factor 2 family protein [Acinetobacter sp. WZC-1]|uniref:nuclear transport factor 2 family protein n=1 Tax=Acinetobacter sp. WZC-1 TaxID=3459034 RepID=UPI00403DDE95